MPPARPLTCPNPCACGAAGARACRCAQVQPLPLPCRPAALTRGLVLGRSAGFTLVELLVVLAVMVVALSAVLPALQDFSSNNQLAALRSGFAGTLALARTEAVKRGLPVLVQARSVGPAGNEYAAGWEVVVDADGDGQAGSAELRVRGQAALPSAMRLSGISPLVFRASGALVGNNDASFQVCRASGSRRGYSITVTPSGGTDVATLETCP